MNYLILDNGGNSIGQNLPLDSHTLGKAYDGLIKVYKFEDGKYWKLQVMAEDKRWVADWMPVRMLT